MEEILTLPGVARKTANVVLGTDYGIAVGVVVDTHVMRLSRRLDLTKHEEPKKIEQDLMRGHSARQVDQVFASTDLAWTARVHCAKAAMHGLQSRNDLLFEGQDRLADLYISLV